MADIKTIGGFDEAKQRKVMSVLLYGTSKAKTALQFETSRGTIIRIEKQMSPILLAEAADELADKVEISIMSAEREANDDSIPAEEEWDGEDGPYYGLTKIPETPFMILVFGL